METQLAMATVMATRLAMGTKLVMETPLRAMVSMATTLTSVSCPRIYYCEVDELILTSLMIRPND